jgi:3-hydroxymyristoyl/3-hydroxydecanoyl-(acyl carrier protein) dehydratase
VTISHLVIAADHPAYPGHFPGMPVLPGVVLLDAALHALGQAASGDSRGWQVATAKFQSVVRPGEALTLEHEALPNGSIRFAILTADRPVANGIIVPPGALIEAHAGQVHSGQIRGEQS